jgi:hypothetical protein
MKASNKLKQTDNPIATNKECLLKLIILVSKGVVFDTKYLVFDYLHKPAFRRQK